MPKNKSSRIKVIGVGGGGTNAVNHMHRLGIKDVDLVVANTDRQSLDASPVVNKIQLGEMLTEGLGAGTNPNRGKEAALESLDNIKEMLGVNTKMLFITAGMGGGTGTGAAPVIAEIAKEMGLLTVGIVTTPFDYEGPKTRKQAEDGIEELKKYVDAVIVISNETLRAEYGDMDIDNAYGKADDILATAAKSIAECITTVGTQNVDFEDVRVALTNSGVALIGNGVAEGKERAMRASELALESKLLNDKDIKGAKFILINVTYGKKKITLEELNVIAHHIRSSAGDDAQVKQGRVFDEFADDKVSVTIIATGFNKLAKQAVQEVVIAEVKPTTTQTLDVSEVKIENNLPSSPAVVNEINLNTPPVNIVEPTKNSFENSSPVERFEMHEEFFKSEIEKAEEEDMPGFRMTNLDGIEFEVMNAPASFQSPTMNNDVQAILDQHENERIEQMKRENLERDEQRKNSLKQLNYKFNSSQPAFQQKGYSLEKTPHSSANVYSESAIIQNANNEPEIKKNPFLHDNVD